MSVELSQPAQRAADRCACAVNVLKSSSPSDVMVAMVAAIRVLPDLDLMGSDEVDELIAHRHESVAYALDFVLFGLRYRMDEWVEAWTRHDEIVLRNATPAGGPHGTIGKWAVGRPPAEEG